MTPTSEQLIAQAQQEPVVKPIAYSYVRFSTAKQELGDSLRRQVEGAKAYCEKHGLELHETSYRDLGVSAFKRKNVEKGALAGFITAVKSGKVLPGSYLIIEQFDRLSRADIDVALELLLHLVRSGIKVVTLSDEKVWDRDAVKDVGNLVLAVVYMSRANNESAMKAERLSAIWSNKKQRAATKTEGAKVVTSEAPRWLRVNGTKTGFEPIPEKVESIEKVFDLRIKGFGVVSIVSRANEERWPVPGKPPVQKPGESLEDYNLRKEHDMTWHTSLVGRLLRNRALLGEYQPHQNDPENEHKRIPVGDPIQGYYPQVIKEEIFLRAAAKAERSGRFPGRRDASLKNWLQGLLVCTCGHAFVRKNKDSVAQPEYARYYCTARNRKIARADGTLCPGASAKELEGAVIAVVSGVAPQFFNGTARLAELKSQADLLEVEVSAAKQTRDRYVEAVGSTKVPIPALIQKLGEAETALNEATHKLTTTRAEIADLSGDTESVFENIVKAIKAVDSLDARAELREDLSRIIEKVVVHQDEGFIRVFLRGNETPIVQPLRSDAALPGITFTTSPAQSAAE
jgi:DNA invertase Pin-like site-specific DNA recombinase